MSLTPNEEKELQELIRIEFYEACKHFLNMPKEEALKLLSENTEFWNFISNLKATENK